jgi:hypothetical protein
MIRGHVDSYSFDVRLFSSAAFCRSPGRQRMFVSGSYRCSSLSPAKRSPLKIGISKRPASGRFCWISLMVRRRNDTPLLSLNGVFSPKLGSRRIYSTSFFYLFLSNLAIYRSTEVRYSFAWRSASTTDALSLQLEDPSAPRHLLIWHLHCVYQIPSVSFSLGSVQKRRRASSDLRLFARLVLARNSTTPAPRIPPGRNPNDQTRAAFGLPVDR